MDNDKGRPAVLVIEDEEAVRRSTGAMVEKAGFKALCAEGGQRGLELFAANRGRVDLVLLDLTMPDISGLQTLAALRAQDPSVPVLLTSGYSESHLGTQLPPGMADGFLHKPFSFEELAAAVRSALRGGAPKPSAAGPI